MSNDQPRKITVEELFPEFVKNPHSWAAMVERYREDVKNWGGFPQMLSLVEYLASREYVASFIPGTTMMRLCVSTDIPFKEPRLDELLILWDDRIQVFQLDYYEAGSSKPDSRTCTESQARHMVELKLLRLKLASLKT